MALHHQQYLQFPFAAVTNTTEFFKSKLKEMGKVKSLYQTIRLIFGISSDRVKIYVAEGKRYYQFDIHDQNIEKHLLGRIYYLPEERRLDIYDSGNLAIPLIQAVGKNIVFKNYSVFLDHLGFDKLFARLFVIT